MPRTPKRMLKLHWRSEYSTSNFSAKMYETITSPETEVSLIFSKLSFFIPAGTILCDFFEFSTNLLKTGTSFPEQEEETQQRQPSTGEY